jgi:Family of unknown function (DUF6459)
MPAPPPTSSPGPRAPCPASPTPPVLPLVPGFGRPPDLDRPLPDAAAVRLLVVPDSAPPYDDEPRAAGRAGRDGDPAGPPSPGRRPGDPRRPAAPPDGGADPAARWPSQFAHVLAETLAGARPPQQITPWTTERARRQIRQIGPQLGAGSLPRVRRVVTCSPAADVVEMTVIVRFGWSGTGHGARARDARRGPRGGCAPRSRQRDGGAELAACIGGLPVTRVAVALLELPPGATRARGVPAHPAMPGAVP